MERREIWRLGTYSAGLGAISPEVNELPSWLTSETDGVAIELEGRVGQFVSRSELLELRMNSVLIDILKKGASAVASLQDQSRQAIDQNTGKPPDFTITRVLPEVYNSAVEQIDEVISGSKHGRESSLTSDNLQNVELDRLHHRVGVLESENKRLAAELEQALRKTSDSVNCPGNKLGSASGLVPPTTKLSFKAITPERDDVGQVKKDKYQALVIKYNDLYTNWSYLDDARKKLETSLRSEKEKLQRWATWAEGQEKLIAKTKAKVRMQEEEIKRLQDRVNELEGLNGLPATGVETTPCGRAGLADVLVKAEDSPVLSPSLLHNIHHTRIDKEIPPYTGTELHGSSSTEGLPEDLPALDEQQSHSRHQQTETLPQLPSSDEPEVISARPVKKRKAKNNISEPLLPKVKVENISSSPIGLAAFGQLSSCEGVDLDEIGDKVTTPRKRHRTIGYSSTGSVTGSFALPDSEIASNQVHDVGDRSPLRVIPNNLYMNNPFKTPGKSVLSTKKPITSRSLSTPGHVSSINSTRNIAEKEPTPAKNSAIERISEGGELLPSSSSLRKTVGRQSNLLHDLLEHPSPHRHTLGTPKDRLLGDSPLRLSKSFSGPTVSDRTSGISAKETPSRQPGQLDQPRSSKRSTQKRQGKSFSATLDDGPLRSKSLNQLGLEHFKVNPNYNHGCDYAFSDVVRKQSDRRCLSGCTKPECCGTKFRRLAEMTLESPGGRTSSQEERNQALLEEFLGDGKHKLNSMSASEKDELLIQAKTRELSNKLGRHRHAFERRKSPPGFWDTDMPSTQEELNTRNLARKAERELVEQRYMEAMRPGGAYIFRDEQ